MKKITHEEVRQQRFASIFTDFGFKRAFGDEEDTRFLRKTIQILIKSKHEIAEVIFDSNDLIGTTDESRSVRFDIFCKDTVGNEYIVEMQLTLLARFVQRAKLYAFQRFNRMAKKGVKGFDNLTKIYVLSFLDGKLFKGKELHHIVNLKNQHGELIDDQINYIFVEMGKWNKSESELTSDFDKLLHFMKYTRTATIEQELPKYTAYENWFESAIKKLETANLSQAEYDAYILALYDEATLKLAEMEKQQKIQEANEKLQKVEEKMKEIEKRTKEVEAKAKQSEAKAKQSEAKAKQSEAKAKQSEAKTKELENQLDITLVRMHESGISKKQILSITGVNKERLFDTLRKYGHQLKD